MDNTANTPPAQPDETATIRHWDPDAPAGDASSDLSSGYDAASQAHESTTPSFLPTALVLPQEECDRYRNDQNKLRVERWDKYGDRIVPEEVSATLAHDIVSDDRYYEYLMRMISTRAPYGFQVCYQIGGDTTGTISVNFANVSESLKQLSNAGAFEGNETATQRVAEVAQLTSAEQMRLDYRGSTYRATIGDALCEIPADELVGLLLADEDDYRKFLENSESFGLQREQIAYALTKFVSGNDLFARYAVPDNILKRYQTLASYEQIDFEAVGQYAATDENEPAQQAVMNDELHGMIVEGMPTDLSDVERAMYVYIKMCRILSYDPEYYAVDQKGPATQKFQNIARIGTITPENNQVVCFEFNALFEKMLDELGIPYETRYGEASKPNQWFVTAGYYGEGHEYCQCRIGNFIVAFDSVTSILGGDLSSAKLGQGLQGMICRNKNGRTQQEFQAAAARAYQEVARTEGQEQSRSADDSAFRQAATMYREIANVGAGQAASFEDRMTRWADALSRQRLAPMDALSYALSLRRVGFTEDQRRDNFSLTIVRENRQGGEATTPIMVLAVNPQGFNASGNDSTYFVLTPQGEMTPMSVDELRRRFDDKQYEYLEGPEAHTIPGVALAEEPNA